MKIRTDISTLSRLYPLFEEAGIEGVLTGDLEKIAELKYADLCGKLLKTGKLAEICEVIADCGDYQGKAWGEISREEAMGILVPFLVNITTGLDEYPEAETSSPNPETSL